MAKKNVHVFLASLLIPILIISCSRDARYDLRSEDIDHLEIYEQNMSILRQNIYDPRDLKFEREEYHHTVFHPLKYDHLVYSLLQLEPKSQGFLKNICESLVERR